MQFKTTITNILLSTLIALSAAAPLSQGCAAHSDSALSNAIKARSYDQIAAVAKDMSSAEIHLSIADAVRDRSVDAVVEDFKAAMKGRMTPPEQLKKDLEKFVQENQKHQKRAENGFQAAQHGCGYYPFYAAGGYECGVGGLLEGLGSYQPNLLTGLGYTVDTLGYGLGLGFLL